MNVLDLQHKSRTARTCALLRDAIVRSQYKPGEKLRIDQLAKELTASSGAVREALSRLTAEGLVQAEPQKGFVVAPISRRDLEDMTEVRVEVEGRCLAGAIAHGDVDWEGRVLSVHHRLRALKGALRDPASREATRWHQLHGEFHNELTSACSNGCWLRLRNQLFVQSERYRRLSGPFDETGRDVDSEHDALAEATLARDVGAALGLMDEHLRRTTLILLSSRIPFSEDGPAELDEPGPHRR